MLVLYTLTPIIQTQATVCPHSTITAHAAGRQSQYDIIHKPAVHEVIAVAHQKQVDATHTAATQPGAEEIAICIHNPNIAPFWILLFISSILSENQIIGLLFNPIGSTPIIGLFFTYPYKFTSSLIPIGSRLMNLPFTGS